jgi:hypothetical protein
VDVAVVVDGDGAWTLLVKDPNTGATGHMGNLATGARLEAPMMAGVAPAPPSTLDGPALRMATGLGTETVVVTVSQDVGPGDPPGTYAITLLWVAIAGF